MRAKEFILDELLEKIIEKLDSLHDLIGDNEWHKRAVWTAGVYDALARAGRDFNYEIYATINETNLPEALRDEYLNPEYGGWLYDVSMAEVKNDYSWSMMLVAECEWGDKSEIKHDFEKLLIARSDFRVMIYHDGQGVTDEEFLEWITRYANNKDGDTYLLAAFKDEGWGYHLIKWPGCPISLE